ncbi:MAG: hypothetical protein IT539_04615 [Bradyrhizobiaceae bacterium]|nr:hypothetical protein [Bradyrhizobiaceae bacterium]
MFRWRKRLNIQIDEAVENDAEIVENDAAIVADDADDPAEPDYGHLPFIDNETLDQFLADPWSVELLPVDPYDYRREIQRMIVSAFLHEASHRAKQIETV